jgi:hypothetical protein
VISRRLSCVRPPRSARYCSTMTSLRALVAAAVVALSSGQCIDNPQGITTLSPSAPPTQNPSPNGCNDRSPGETGWTCGGTGGCTCHQLASFGYCDHDVYSTGTRRVCCQTCLGPYGPVSLTHMPLIRLTSPLAAAHAAGVFCCAGWGGHCSNSWSKCCLVNCHIVRVELASPLSRRILCWSTLFACSSN